MKKQIKVCFLFHSSGRGGAEKILLLLLDKLIERGIQILVLLPDKGPVEEYLYEKAIPYKIIPYRMWMDRDYSCFKLFKRFIRNFISINKVYKSIKLFGTDIIYTNTCTLPIGGIVARIMNKPHIWHFREFGYEDHGFKYDLGEKLSLKITNKLSTYCLTNSYAVAKKYSKFIPENKIEVVYESYQNENSDGKQNSKIEIDRENFQLNCVIVGSIYPTKGQSDAIEAIASLKEIGVNVKLYIIGEGKKEYIFSLKEKIKILNIESNIQFTGHLTNAENFLNNFDLLLMCSRSEAYGLVTLEAMKSGIPVIGTNSGGTPELIIDGGNGLLYMPGDIKQLSQNILFFCINPLKIKEMGEYGKYLAETKFKAENYYQGIYNVLMKFSS